VEYDQHFNGQEIEEKLNEEFDISLDEARTAGYRWVIKSTGLPVCQFLEETNQPNSTGVGGSGQHRWRFRAVDTGKCEIKFYYLRPWENSAEPARTFVLKVRVVA
jgi:predicted secreted protein